jgi:putative ABC transport system ATP-binding protein
VSGEVRSTGVPLLVAENVRRTYTVGNMEVHAVGGVTLTLEAGDFVALVGPSGCGKSTLLHLCGAMDRPSSGTVRLESAVLDRLGDDELTRIRRERVGFVFQFFNLLPTLTLLENVELPLLLSGQRPATAQPAARALLDRVGLGPRLHHYPPQLSGGEMQRGALARALIHRPALVIADEPTGNLDSENGQRVLALLTELNRETGVTMLLATHAPDIAAAAGRVVRMRDGRIEPERPAGAPL